MSDEDEVVFVRVIVYRGKKARVSRTLDSSLKPGIYSMGPGLAITIAEVETSGLIEVLENFAEKKNLPINLLQAGDDRRQFNYNPSVGPDSKFSSEPK